MASAMRLKAADWAGFCLVLLIGGGLTLFRQFAIVPRATVGLCAAANAPAFCAPRAAVLWLQYEQAFGWATLALGLIAFYAGQRLVAALAIGLGIAAVANYNATMGIIGAALGLLAWAGRISARYAAG